MPSGILQDLCPSCLLKQGADLFPGTGSKPFEPPPESAIAALFPNLEILNLLGAGGMGAVYKARQPALDRLVALKILPQSIERDASFEERFNREARALARLSHPNIVAVHEFGQVGDLNFFIMEFVDGANLRQLERAGRLSSREALQIIPQICDALQYAHDEGVVHRDIKPENVLINRKGRVKIADFGLAKILGIDVESLRLTAEGQVMGTPHYMAPEQIENPLTVDHRADIFSLGVVFYEMLTGDLPLGRFSPPSRKVQVDVRLDEVVLRALENDPNRRYQHASDVKSNVETIVGSPASEAVPPSSRLRWRWPTKKEWAGAIAVSMAWLIFQVHWLTPWLNQRFGRIQAAQIAQTDAASGSMTVNLPGSGTVELLAVGKTNTTPDGWWHPDGSPIPGASFTVRSTGSINVDNQEIYQFLFKLSNLPNGADQIGVEAEPVASSAGGGKIFLNDQPMKNGRPVLMAWKSDVRKVTLRSGFALEPWRTIAIENISSQRGTQMRTASDPNWTSSFQRPPYGSVGNAQISLVFGPKDPHWAHRVVAVDTNGVEHTYSTGDCTPVEQQELWTYAFKDLPFSSVKEFQLQVRPVHWIEFRDIRLAPNFDLPLPTTDGHTNPQATELHDDR